jgi:hypothetical protein
VPPHALQALRRSIVAVGVLFACAVLLVLSPRMTALALSPVVLLTLVLWVITKRWRYAGMALAGFAFLALLPIDVRPQHWFGSPKVLPVVMGLPSEATHEAAQRGDVWLGGCIVSVFDPLWVVTW